MRKLLVSLLVLFTFSASQAQIIGSLPYTLTNGTTADASQVMANYNYIISQVNSNGATAGTNSNITALVGLSTPLSAAQGGSQIYIGGTSTGSANAQVVSAPLIPTGFSLVNKPIVCFSAGATNISGGTTLNVNSTGVTSVLKQTPYGLQSLAGGEFTSGQLTCVQYDGTQYEWITNSYQPGNFLFGNAGLTTTTTVASSSCGSYYGLGTGTYTVNLPTPSSAPAQVCTLAFNSGASAVATLSTPSGAFVPTGGSTFAVQASEMLLAITDGTNWNIGQLVNPSIPNSSIGHSLPGANSLKITNDGTTPNTKIDVSATYVTLANSSGVSTSFTSFSCTLNLSINGLNGLDTGSIAASTWYNIYIISNLSTTGCLASTNSSSPTLPSGYTYFYRVGAMETDGSNNLYRTLQTGNKSRYVITGTSNTSSYPFTTTSATSSWVAYQVTGNNTGSPTTSTEVLSNLYSVSGLESGVAPNANYAAPVSGNPMPWISRNSSASNVTESQVTNIPLESNSIYFWSSNTGNILAVAGWVDAVNAN